MTPLWETMDHAAQDLKLQEPPLLPKLVLTGNLFKPLGMALGLVQLGGVK